MDCRHRKMIGWCCEAVLKGGFFGESRNLICLFDSTAMFDRNAVEDADSEVERAERCQWWHARP